MSRWIMVLALAGTAWSQAMVEHAAAAAGGSVGGVAGKKLSDSINKVMGKVDDTAKAAAADKSNKSKGSNSGALLQVGPGEPKGKDDSGVVPPPVPAHRAALVKPTPAPEPVAKPEPAPPAPPPPPPPEVTTDDLKKVVNGMPREEVLKLGAPASRVTMFDDGHMLEIFRYIAHDNDLGVVRLTDGAVSSIVIR